MLSESPQLVRNKREASVRQHIADRIVNAIRDVAGTEDRFQVVELQNNCEHSDYRMIGDFHIDEGEGLHQITVRTFPRYNQENFYVQIRKQSRSLAEIHNTNEAETELLWSYRPATYGGKEQNELRKQRFVQMYGSPNVNISVPSGDITAIDFLHDLIFVAKARIAAHNLDANIDGIENDVFMEGRRIYGFHTRKERSTRLVTEAKRRHRRKSNGRIPCAVCNLDFEERYGHRGQGFIEAHHIVPLNELSDETETCVEDLAMVCANCHRMLHRSPSITVEQLREHLENNDEDD